ncbi:hypothetical protein BX600DRAFT_14362 [Xylariales sp. PMI_506]|nr:hypothetical protein BX600DRAFT_14362 [Xylariales sp. PMI_506]
MPCSHAVLLMVPECEYPRLDVTRTWGLACTTRDGGHRVLGTASLTLTVSYYLSASLSLSLTHTERHPHTFCFSFLTLYALGSAVLSTPSARFARPSDLRVARRDHCNKARPFRAWLMSLVSSHPRGFFFFGGVFFLKPPLPPLGPIMKFANSTFRSLARKSWHP